MPEKATPILLQSDSRQALAVRSVNVRAHVDGPFGRTVTTVTFTNDLGGAVEGDLVFPLPPSAALSSLLVKVGARELRVAMNPRARAKADFARAVDAGRTAALGETEGEDLARLRVAPIADGEDVVVTMTVVHALAPTMEGHTLIVPLTYMPRFVEDESRLKDTERAAIDRPRPVTISARADVEILIRHTESGSARDGAETPAIRCASHTTNVERRGRSSTVRVAQAPLDRDLLVEIVDRSSDASIWARHDDGDGPDGKGPTTAVAIVPPAFADEGQTVPRTVTFLVDRSGSMGGRPMQAAIRAVRGALRALGPDDRFNVIAFDDRLEALAPRPLPFEDATLKAADVFVSQLTARGGTNASIAIAAALEDAQASSTLAHYREAPKSDGAHRLRVVVFMTDGDVAGAEQVLREARARLVDTRVHVLGIGDAVNHAMLAAIAREGGGTYTPVATDEDLERALVRLKNATYAPVWTGIRARIEGAGDPRSPEHLEPQGAMDLFAGEPFVFAWRGKVARGDRLVLEGERAGGATFKLVAPFDADDPDAIAPTLWALLKNRRLTYRFDDADDAALESLGTTFGVTNRAVALVAVDAEKRDVTIEARVPVVLPLPRNVAAMPPPGAHMNMTMAGAIAAPRAAAPRMVQPAPAPAMYAPEPDDLSFDEAEDDDDERALRALLLRQRADGLFDGDLLVTLAAIAALASRGHTARAGLFRAELARTLKTLRAMAASTSGDDRASIDAAIGMLTGASEAATALSPFIAAFAASPAAAAIASRFPLG